MESQSSHHRRLAALALAATFGLAEAALAQPAPPPPNGPAMLPDASPQPAAPQTVPISGTVQSYNLGPRGNVEGLMIKTADRMAQVNLPPDLGAVVAQHAPIGSAVRVNGIPQLGMPDHAVYDFYSLKAGDRELKVPTPGDERFVHLDSTISQLNYGRRGEVNGVMLDTGDFVHFGPDAAGALNLQAGQKLTVDGVARPMLMSGHQSIDAVAINGQLIHRRPGPSGPAERPGSAHGPGARGRNGPEQPPGRPDAPPAPPTQDVAAPQPSAPTPPPIPAPPR